MSGRLQSTIVTLGLAVAYLVSGGAAVYALVVGEPLRAMGHGQTQQPLMEKPFEPIDESEGDIELDERECRNSQLSDESLDAMESEDFPGGPSERTAGARVSKVATSVRLPRYFGGLVDQQQRTQIQEIHLQFRGRIAELAKQLDLLRQQELEAMEQVLTDSQRKLLAKKRHQARVSRVAAKDDSGETTSGSGKSSNTESKSDAGLRTNSTLSSEAEGINEHPDPTAT